MNTIFKLLPILSLIISISFCSCASKAGSNSNPDSDSSNTSNPVSGNQGSVSEEGNAAAEFKNEFTKEKLITLAEGEMLCNDESALMVCNKTKDYYVVTKTGTDDKTQYFIYENGNKKGPFREITESMTRKTEDKCGTCDENFLNQGDPSLLTYDEGQMVVNLKDKKFKLGMIFSALLVTPDRAKAFAVVNRDGKNYFIDSDGREAEISGTGTIIKSSYDGKIALVCCTGSINLDSENIDYTKMAEAMENVTIYTIEGKKFGPFKKLSCENIWIPCQSQNWLFKHEKKLYVNGTFIKEFEYIDKNRIWVSEDGKRHATLLSDKLVFSDGSSFKYPLKLRSEKIDGRIFIRWVSIESNELISYKKEL